MIEAIYIVILIVSFLVIVILFWKKISFLTEISEFKKDQKKNIASQFRKRISSLLILKSSFWSGILVKILSKSRVGILRIENKIGKILQFLRIKAQKDKENGK
jgi:O-antigen/teichoic acid export membrane protein